ncbi:GNAT family N-acetyltransferase [soil metagenome]
MIPHPLDNVIWTALRTHQRPLAVGTGLAVRFPADVAPFAAMEQPTPAAFDALFDLAVPDTELALFTLEEVVPGERFEVTQRGGMVQMICRELIAPADTAHEITVMTEADVPEMLALVALTKPGPFLPRTRTLGTYLGVRIDGRLVAMSGERLHAAGHVEVSAVCTHPDHRGRGFAAQLIAAVCRGIAQRGETPFLHAFHDNPAISTYRRLGFELRAKPRLTVLRRPASTSAA